MNTVDRAEDEFIVNYLEKHTCPDMSLKDIFKATGIIVFIAIVTMLLLVGGILVGHWLNVATR